jgi:hypothetical protein
MPISQIDFQNVRIHSREGVSLTDVNNIKLDDVDVECTAAPPIQLQNVTHLITNHFLAELHKQ